ncbi:MAG TPA: hypothetical protein VFC17_05250 [Candidatus Limnocylindrales bacterium]|nr:hypothetical protein [Candidatus Limnocylindrales bacterium]
MNEDKKTIAELAELKSALEKSNMRIAELEKQVESQNRQTERQLENLSQRIDRK